MKACLDCLKHHFELRVGAEALHNSRQHLIMVRFTAIIELQCLVDGAEVVMVVAEETDVALTQRLR